VVFILFLFKNKILDLLLLNWMSTFWLAIS